jgi:hypothetical protein
MSSSRGVYSPDNSIHLRALITHEARNANAMMMNLYDAGSSSGKDAGKTLFWKKMREQKCNSSNTLVTAAAAAAAAPNKSHRAKFLSFGIFNRSRSRRRRLRRHF